MKNILRIIGCIVVSTLLCVGSTFAATISDYCITPPFIQTPIPPNLLLMIDNSASMFDLAYQDTGILYCANAPTTSCSAGSTCTGTATCAASVTTTTATTWSAKACTADSQCPNSTATSTPRTCLANSDCPTYRTLGGNANGCNNGQNTCKNSADNIITPKCSGGYCTTCNTSTGVGGDCVAAITTTSTPIACTTDPTCSAVTTGDTCNNKCTVTRQCYDTSYTTTTTYYGYFDSTATYSYDFANNKFMSGGTMPGTCTYSAGTTKYLCVNTSGTPELLVSTGSTGFVANGNFLNWLTSSKFDVEKKILTGGKFDTTNSVLVGESRGCAGRKFIKSVPGVSLTFAIAGGTPGGLSSTQNQATEYGQTYIEVHAGTYNASQCLSAMNDWMTLSTSPVNLGTFQGDTKGCVGAGNGAYNATSTWNHILHDCYDGIVNKAQGYSTNLGPLEGECKSAYASIAPSAITDPNSGIAICSSVISYTDASGATKTGYLGACYNTVTGTFSSPCDTTQMENYCTLNINTNPVVDPTSTALTGAGSSAPGFILEQGLMNTTLAGTLSAKVGLATVPTGLIDKYKDQIRFGAMTFQNNGSGAECSSTSSIPCWKACKNGTDFTTRMCYLASDCPSGQTCDVLPKADGGQMIAYVGAGNCSVTTATVCKIDADCASGQTCLASVGTHAPDSGLINSLDGIQATSWTPYAEAFYNAIGYFARYNDPNYANTLTPPSRTDANFSVLPSPNTVTSYTATKNPSLYKCQQNNILLITDGMSTADQNSASENFAALYASQVPNVIGGSTTYGISGYDTTNHCPSYSGSRSISDLAWVAKNLNIKTLATSSPASTVATATPTSASEFISSYVVYTGPQTSSQPGLCNPYTLMSNTARNGGTSLYLANNPASLYTQLDKAFTTVAAQAASGTAASILNNSEGSGANLLQAVFYPMKDFGGGLTNNTASWIGELQNLWYFIDPFFNRSTVRVDSNSDYSLDLNQDYIAKFRFDSINNKTFVDLTQDVNGDGTNISVIGSYDPDDPNVKSLWRAGRKLWERNVTSDPRKIYTVTSATALTTPTLMANDGVFNAAAANITLLQAADSTSAGKIIDFVSGKDQTGFRRRMVTISACGLTDTQGCIREWKLGDIINSTPRLVSTLKINNYSLDPPSGYGDASYGQFASSYNYKHRGMAFVGGNDGMLHAFRLGILDESGQTKQHKAKLLNTDGTPATSASDLGREEWAFIPRNALPYLAYTADPNYSHLYFVDNTPSIFDASINAPTGCSGNYYDCARKTTLDTSKNLNLNQTSWRTILIGGMGFGGASRDSTTPTSATAGGCDDKVSTGTCVKTPITGVGYSSYFALDVTNPHKPFDDADTLNRSKFLWEFNGDPTNGDYLGYSTSGPAIVRVGAKDKNGRWFAMFASGPTGPIDSTSRSFYGKSNQNLKLFVVDIATGTLLRTIDTGIANAFAGNISNAVIDNDRWDKTRSGFYSDDAIYIGYTTTADATPTATSVWNKGGIIRLFTKEDTSPANWVFSTVINNIGPVTTSVAKLQDRFAITGGTTGKLWLYFGTGRYFQKADSLSDQFSLYGLIEPCYSKHGASPGFIPTGPTNEFDTACTTSVVKSSMTDQTGSATTAPAATLTLGSPGWYINLDCSGTAAQCANTPVSDGYSSERVITNPVTSTAGAVFFTTFKPTSDFCGYGGNSYIWALRYDSGGAPPAAAMQGKVLMQVSTGAIAEISLATAFKSSTGNLGFDARRTDQVIPGMPPPNNGFALITNPKPVKKILHYQEK